MRREKQEHEMARLRIKKRPAYGVFFRSPSIIHGFCHRRFLFCNPHLNHMTRLTRPTASSGRQVCGGLRIVDYNEYALADLVYYATSPFTFRHKRGATIRMLETKPMREA